MLSLNVENYYSKEADAEYLSVSQYKAWKECENKAHYEYVQPGVKPPTPSYFLEGSFGHSYFEGRDAFDKFVKANESKICYKSATSKGKLLSEYAKILEGCQRVEQCSSFMEYLKGVPEYIGTVEMLGKQWKFRYDNIDVQKGIITDLKFLASYDLDEAYPFYEKYGYWTNMSLYKAFAEKVFDKKFTVYLALIEKSANPRYDILKMDIDDRMAYEVSEAERYVKERYDQARSGFALHSCEKCYVCKMNNKFQVKEAKDCRGMSHLANNLPSWKRTT